MQEVSHKIHIKKNGTQYDVNLYDNKFPSPDIFFPVKISGNTYYMPVTSYLKEDVAGGSTPLRIKKDGVTYQVIKKAECNINIPSYANQKIVVEVTNSITGKKDTFTNTNATEGNINTVVVPFGSSFTAAVQGTNSSYNAGSMTSVTSGVITDKNINLTASPATIIVPTGSIELNYWSKNFTVPHGVNRIKAVSYNMTKYINVPANQICVVKTAGNHDDGYEININNVLVAHSNKASTVTCTVSWGPSINI